MREDESPGIITYSLEYLSHAPLTRFCIDTGGYRAPFVYFCLDLIHNLGKTVRKVRVRTVFGHGGIWKLSDWRALPIVVTGSTCIEG